MEAQIRQLRVKLDQFLQEAEVIRDQVGYDAGNKKAGRHLSLSITHLEDARMRLGAALGEMGCNLPPEYADRAPRDLTT